jgi:hypothetical protein
MDPKAGSIQICKSSKKLVKTVTCRSKIEKAERMARARGRPRGPPTARLDGHLPVELLDRIEAWRLSQPVPPSKIKAIEYLLNHGLAAAQHGARDIYE